MAAIDQALADGVDDIAFLFAADAGMHVATSNGKMVRAPRP